MRILLSATAIAALLAALPASAQDRGSSAYQAQTRGERRIPVCTKQLGTIAIVEPDKQWWRELNLGSPEAIIKIFVQRSGCFKLVNRGAAMASVPMRCEQTGMSCMPWVWSCRPELGLADLA